MIIDAPVPLQPLTSIGSIVASDAIEEMVKKVDRREKLFDCAVNHAVQDKSDIAMKHAIERNVKFNKTKYDFELHQSEASLRGLNVCGENVQKREHGQVTNAALFQPNKKRKKMTLPTLPSQILLPGMAHTPDDQPVAY